MTGHQIPGGTAGLVDDAEFIAMGIMVDFQGEGKWKREWKYGMVGEKALLRTYILLSIATADMRSCSPSPQLSDPQSTGES